MLGRGKRRQEGTGVYRGIAYLLIFFNVFVHTLFLKLDGVARCYHPLLYVFVKYIISFLI